VCFTAIVKLYLFLFRTAVDLLFPSGIFDTSEDETIRFLEESDSDEVHTSDVQLNIEQENGEPVEKKRKKKGWEKRLSHPKRAHPNYRPRDSARKVVMKQRKAHEQKVNNKPSLLFGEGSEGESSTSVSDSSEKSESANESDQNDQKPEVPEKENCKIERFDSEKEKEEKRGDDDDDLELEHGCDKKGFFQYKHALFKSEVDMALRSDMVLEVSVKKEAPCSNPNMVQSEAVSTTEPEKDDGNNRKTRRLNENNETEKDGEENKEPRRIIEVEQPSLVANGESENDEAPEDNEAVEEGELVSKDESRKDEDKNRRKCDSCKKVGGRVNVAIHITEPVEKDLNFVFTF